MSLLSLILPNGKNGFGYGTTAEEVTNGIDCTGKVILITGCNSGLGKESMRVLYKRGARIIGLGRDKNKVEGAFKEFDIKNGISFSCELSDPKSVMTCVQDILKLNINIDVFLCNAGIMALPRLEKSNGYEIQFFTNHIGHFLLVTKLLPLLKDDGRVVMLSSAAHNAAPKGGIDFDNLDGSKGYQPWTAYGQSKMANLLFAKSLSKRFGGTGKMAFAVHPGVIPTNLGRHMNPILNNIFKSGQSIFLKNIQEGAATQCYAAVHPDVANSSGKYLADCNIKSPRKDAEDLETAEKLWRRSEEIISQFVKE
jgi:NAD(P)-dependent dehydrogenase (short-subunit alcohol dehydrogenase family)